MSCDDWIRVAVGVLLVVLMACAGPGPALAHSGGHVHPAPATVTVRPAAECADACVAHEVSDCVVSTCCAEMALGAIAGAPAVTAPPDRRGGFAAPAPPMHPGIAPGIPQPPPRA